MLLMLNNCYMLLFIFNAVKCNLKAVMRLRDMNVLIERLYFTIV